MLPEMQCEQVSVYSPILNILLCLMWVLWMVFYSMSCEFVLLVIEKMILQISDIGVGGVVRSSFHFASGCVVTVSVFDVITV